MTDQLLTLLAQIVVALFCAAWGAMIVKGMMQ